MTHDQHGVRVVAVLGMHRSGTSWLTGSLQQLGVELGEVSESAPHNRRGNRENRRLRELHENVLQANGGSWRRPRWPNRWPPKLREELGRHIAEMNSRYPLWGFKDPRSLLVLDEWHRQVPDLIRIGIYRHPEAVYRSFHARNPNFKRDEAIRLWRIYNERLIEEHRTAPFPLIRFDADADALRVQLGDASKQLGLPGAGQEDEFFDAALVHNVVDEPIPDDAAALWEELSARALSVVR